jgi:hypothetical protein
MAKKETVMSLPPLVTQAGPYKINFTPCPFYHMRVDLTAPRAGILHTTEGGFSGSMQVFKEHFAPHFELGINRDGQVQINQLVQIGYIGAACCAHNNKAIVQIEMVGFSKPDPWFPDDKTADALAHLLVVLEAQYAIPLSHPWDDDDWPRAGINPHRNAGKFGHVSGWFGHGDMPDPDTHWDPGHFQWSKLFDLANGIKKTTGVA